MIATLVLFRPRTANRLVGAGPVVQVGAQPAVRIYEIPALTEGAATPR